MQAVNPQTTESGLQTWVVGFMFYFCLHSAFFFFFFFIGIGENILKPEDFILKKSRFRNSLAVQWLELYTLIAEDLGSISG